MTPDTSSYYHVGYTVIAAIYIVYIAGLRARSKRAVARLRAAAQKPGTREL